MLRKLMMVLATISTVGVGCAGDPEENSGPDAYRDAAETMPMEEWVPGDLNADEGDRTDWKGIIVETAGELTVEFSADKSGAAVDVAVFDRYGYALGSTARPKGSEETVKVTVDAKLAGKYFVRIQHRGGVATAYSVRALAGESSGGDSGGGGAPLPDL